MDYYRLLRRLDAPVQDAFSARFPIAIKPTAVGDSAWSFQAAVAGGGEVGPPGPRTGNSSGILPGNSSGLCGSPGSCTGAGISGWGFGDGLSRGGSAGFPGWIGGSSTGSIGIASILCFITSGVEG
jgi:hypothetical protein